MAPSTNIDEAIANLTAEVEETAGVEASAIALIAGFAAQVRANREAPAKLDALADAMDAKSKELAAAILAAGE